MRCRFLCVLWFMLGTLPALVNPLQTQPAGPLVVVGGGSTGEEIVTRTLELAGGPAAVVAVLPQSSAVADAGDGSVQMWLEAGARESSKVGVWRPQSGSSRSRPSHAHLDPGGAKKPVDGAISGRA